MRPKLTAPPSLVTKLTPAVAQSPANEQERSRYRDRTQHWRAWYKTQRWATYDEKGDLDGGVRLRVFIRDGFTCRMCERFHYNPKQLTCDHIRPHRGDAGLFWDEGNLQTLCSDPCHIKHKQRLESEFTRD